ncbi:MAG: orotidine-5'-phosphate decarboxylase [Phycisphaeraceae bacterium]|nr:orotidine-5'-phosphate decarboxylase [Phycisphaeraceae bacterium]
MPHHFADRLLDACKTKGAPVCVGLDPVLERLPDAIDQSGPVAAIEAFCLGVIDAVAGVVPAVKPQSACFERYGAPGVAVYHRAVAHAKAAGLIVVGDAKRGDIGTSSAHYAHGLLADPHGCDSLTVNGYLGGDGIEPFQQVARAQGKGLFVLVRTSNPGGDAIQSLPLADGRTVSEAVGDVVAGLGADCVGESGYSNVGMVVGATKPEDAAKLRQRYPQQLFLVPGFGAQGGGAEDVRACFKPDGTGALITASRSVIYVSHEGNSTWQQVVEQAAIQLRDDVSEIMRV